jgi:23S rRNA (uracil1939-C5)-methyltransferase
VCIFSCIILYLYRIISYEYEYVNAIFVGIESCLPAIEDARINAKINKIDNIQFICAKAEDIFFSPSKVEQVSAKESPLPQSFISTKDVVIVNPPRKGCHSSLLEAIQWSGPRYIVYISCNPLTLARDLDHLANREGAEYNDTLLSKTTSMSTYKVRRVQPVDMFPHTAHVETVVFLERV